MVLKILLNLIRYNKYFILDSVHSTIRNKNVLTTKTNACWEAEEAVNSKKPKPKAAN